MLKRIFNSAGDHASRTRAQEGVAGLQHFPHTALTAGPGDEAGCWTFPAHLDNPNCRWLRALKDVYAKSITFPASLSPEAGQLLHALVLNARPRCVLETGMFLGISTLWMGGALEVIGGDGVIHSIDDFRPIRKGHWRREEMLDGREAVVREHIERAGLSHRVVIHTGNSAEGVASVAAEMLKESDDRSGKSGVQLAFLDADHSPEGVRAEFEALEPVLATGGYVVLHDIYPEVSRWKGPRRLMETVNSFARGRYEVIDLYLAPANFGLGVMRRVG